MAAITIENLTKQYGDILAVNDLDLTIEEGEIFGFLGPNGAGKSTTIDILLDFVRPTSGTVTVLGYDAQSAGLSVRQQTGVLPDAYHVYRENKASASGLDPEAVHASIMVGISATTGSTSKATTIALGFFVVAELLWDVVPMGILYVVNGFSFPQQIPDWVFAMMQLSPSTAFFSTVIATVPNFGDNTTETGSGVGVDAANGVLLSPELGYVVLLFWFVGPLAFGYYRFTRADI